MKYILILISILCVSVLTVNCVKRLNKAGGDETEIIVFADEETFNVIEEELSSALEREVFTPTKEIIFTLKPKLPSEIAMYGRRRNVLMVDIVNKPFIDSVLSLSAKGDVNKGKTFVFGEKDIFAKGQSVLVVSARNLDELREVIRVNNDVIFTYFFQAILQRIRDVLYKDSFQEELGERLSLSYNFTIDIPPGWKIEEHGEKRLLKIYRHYPDRFITIYWEYSPRPLLSFDEACDLRNSICVELHDGDKVDRERSRMFNVDFQNMNAQKLEGTWENDELVMGGPFRTYIFSTDEAFYFIDVYVFAPGEKKWIPLHQLASIISTWREG